MVGSTGPSSPGPTPTFRPLASTRASTADSRVARWVDSRCAAARVVTRGAPPRTGREPVLAVVRAGAPEADLVALLRRLREDLDAELMVISDRPAALDLATWPVPLPQGTPEWLGPIVSIAPGQLHAFHLTRARGLDPELPRHLRKVTRTT